MAWWIALIQIIPSARPKYIASADAASSHDALSFSSTPHCFTVVFSPLIGMTAKSVLDPPLIPPFTVVLLRRLIPMANDIQWIWVPSATCLCVHLCRVLRCQPNPSAPASHGWLAFWFPLGVSGVLCIASVINASRGFPEPSRPITAFVLGVWQTQIAELFPSWLLLTWWSSLSSESGWLWWQIVRLVSLVISAGTAAIAWTPILALSSSSQLHTTQWILSLEYGLSLLAYLDENTIANRVSMQAGRRSLRSGFFPRLWPVAISLLPRSIILAFLWRAQPVNTGNLPVIPTPRVSIDLTRSSRRSGSRRLLQST